ncbi:hypothetical protein [Bradyrhizobium sp. USDA 4350]
MKRLLLGPALLAPFALLGYCGLHKEVPQLPKVPEVVRQIPLDDFDHFKPTVPYLAPKAPAKKPIQHHQVKKHERDVHSSARPLPPAGPVAVPEELPPQQGVICIFPFNMIPTCTPGVP